MHEERLRKRLRHVRWELDFWSRKEKAEAHRGSAMRFIEQCRRAIHRLREEEVSILKALGEYDPSITYLPPGVNNIPTYATRFGQNRIRRKETRT